MTHSESLMLAVCFGAVMGSFIGNIIIIVLIKFAVEDHRKKRRRAEEAARKEVSKE